MYISRGEAVAVFGRSLWNSLPAGISSVPVGVSSVTVRGCPCVWGIRLWQYGEKAFSKSPGWWLDCHRLPPSYQVGWISTNKLVLVQKRTRILGYLSHSIRNRDGIFSRGAAALGVAGSSLLAVAYWQSSYFLNWSSSNKWTSFLINVLPAVVHHGWIWMLLILSFLLAFFPIGFFSGQSVLFLIFSPSPPFSKRGRIRSYWRSL